MTKNNKEFRDAQLISLSEVYDESMKYFLSPKNTSNYIEETRKILIGAKKDYKMFSHELFKVLYSFPRNQFSAVKWVNHHSSLKKNDRIISSTLASFYNTKKGYASISQEVIAEITGVSLRTVGNSFQELKRSGEWLIFPAQAERGSVRTFNHCYLLPPLGYGFAMTMWEKPFRRSNQNFKEYFNEAAQSALENKIRTINNGKTLEVLEMPKFGKEQQTYRVIKTFGRYGMPSLRVYKGSKDENLASDLKRYDDYVDLFRNKDLLNNNEKNLGAGTIVVSDVLPW